MEKRVSWLSSFWTITAREMRAYFTSPVGYVVFAMFLFAAGFFYASVILSFKQASMQATFQNIIVLMLFLTPIITMRLFAEEKKLGTLELLMTKPVSDVSVVLGKYFASVLYFLVLLLPSAVYVTVLFRFGSPDVGPMISGYIGVLLIGLAFLALGTFASVLTENQIIAVVLSFVFLLFFWAVDILAGVVGSTSQGGVLSYLSLRAHQDDFTRGIIDVEDIVYYVSFVAFWLFATVKMLSARKWK